MKDVKISGKVCWVFPPSTQVRVTEKKDFFKIKFEISFPIAFEPRISTPELRISTFELRISTFKQRISTSEQSLICIFDVNFYYFPELSDPNYMWFSFVYRSKFHGNCSNSNHNNWSGHRNEYDRFDQPMDVPSIKSTKNQRFRIDSIHQRRWKCGDRIE